MKKKYIGYSLGTMKKCPVCGKVFLMPDSESWVYRRCKQKDNTEMYFCKWSCMRKYDADRAERRKKALEAQREARAKAKHEEMAGGIEPVTEVKAHYTIHRCGQCGKQVGMDRKTCRHCGVLIDWGIYVK